VVPTALASEVDPWEVRFSGIREHVEQIGTALQSGSLGGPAW
jgi:hypothetical protein